METITPIPSNNYTTHTTHSIIHQHNGPLVHSGENDAYSIPYGPQYYDRPKYVVRAESLEMGALLNSDTFVSEVKYTEGIFFVINHIERTIKVEFEAYSYEFKLEIDFKNIDGEIYAEKDGSQQSITIANKYPAKYWINDAERKTWKRRARIQNVQNQGPLQPYMPEFDEQLGKWVVFRITFDLDNVGKKLRSIVDRLSGSMKFKQLRVVNAVNATGYLNKSIDNSMLNFDVLYMTECCMSFNFIHYYNLDDEFFTLLSRQPIQSALYILGKIYEGKKRIFNPLSYLQSEIRAMKQNNISSKKTPIPSHSVMMRKVVISPTTMYVLSPNLETGNRVIRRFRKQKENFLRVQFVDEASGRVGSSYEDRNDTYNYALYNRIFHTLSNGIKIGDKNYEFLAFSASQLREHSCWFYAQSDDLTVDQIREWMGDFSENKTVAKYAARMGQCFSSTRAIQYLHVDDIIKIPDITSEDGKYTFSDGIGKISSSLARKIADKLELKNIPSAFQFRMAGCKGMLCQWPSVPGNQVQVRPSQDKFNSSHNVLEIIRRSTYIPSYLNRQAITLLSVLGIPDNVFIDMMAERVNELNKMDNDMNAISVLQYNIDEYGISKILAQLVKAGFLQRKDRYLINVIELFRIKMLGDLKKKAKIRVAKGTFLLGVLDETGTLKENQIYCSISSDQNNSTVTKTIIGTCAVWRNPCFHPGDIRVVEAVECEALSHLVDVIVFPSVGYRDIPNQCSGGDLDGDDFTLIYDERMIPKHTYPPMDYKSQTPVKVDQVKMDDIKRFFVNYVCSDHLGKIANAHLAKADHLPGGAFHEHCIQLAQLHSDAVDFPKSGIPAKFPKELRATKFPDFMEKPDKPSYISEKVLGILYRSVEVQEFKIRTNTNVDDRLYVEGYETYLDDARNLKSAYDASIKGLMSQFGVMTEFEVTSGFVVNTITKVDKKKPRDLEKSMMDAFMPIKQYYRREFEREFYDEATNIIPPEAYHRMEAKAYAWYHVTYHPSQLKYGEESVESTEYMISFPWVIYERLCEIAIRNNNRTNRNIRTPLEQRVDNNINIVNNNFPFSSFSYHGTSDNIEDDIEVLKQRV